MNGVVSNGFISRISINNHIARILTGTGNDIIVANGDGISGNPSISAGSNLAKQDSTNTYTLPQNFALIVANGLSNDSSNNLYAGANNLSTNSTNGFVYVPFLTGNPTSTPTNNNGRSPIVWDATNNKMWVFSGGIWNSIGLSTSDIQSGGFKNKIIGGDFSTNPWQRGTSFATVINGAYTADRWSHFKIGTAVQTASKSADSPTATQSGIYSPFSLGLVVTTAQNTFAINDYSLIYQKIEGINIASLGFGQSGTRNVTLSFWVKGAKIGIHCVAFRSNGPTRSYVAEYTIIAANTWEFKSITIPVDTGGTWLYDNGVGIDIIFNLACGTNARATPGLWQTGNFFSSANQVNELDAVGNTFKIALVQFEAGSTATPFEIRDVGRELALCQRYYWQREATAAGYSANGLTSGFTFNVPLPVPFRATPTVITNITDANYSASGAPASPSWGLQTIGVAVATKTGTVTVTAYATTTYIYIFGYTVTFSIATNFFAPSAGTIIIANAEL